ncbi:MAG: glycosyltransferase family 4 protein [Prevotellaceae bacterium]|nr:glycosyltransferase family 4 protein [Candidatus Faecinaster equi]
MKILFCDNRLGGLFGFRIDVIRHFIQQGHEVVLVCPKPETEWDRIGQTDLQHVRIVYIPMDANGKNPIKDLHLMMSYYSLFCKERPDWIITYTIKPNIFGGLAARLLHIPVVSMIAGLGYAFDGNSVFKKLLRCLYRFGLKKTRRVLVLNQSNYDTVLAYHLTTQDKLILLNGGEGVNLDQYPATQADFTNGVTFLVISRVLYDKGYQEYVDALAKMPKDSQTHFQWLGPTAFDSPLGVPQKVFEADCQKGYFEYLGVTNDVTQYMGKVNAVIVLPSFYLEGMNRSLMEACAMGRPIITTNIPGCREMVDEGKNGFWIPPRDSQALAEAMLQFISLSEEQKRAMAQFSHKLALQKFDVRKVIDVYDRICCQNDK